MAGLFLTRPKATFYHCSNVRASLQRVGNSQGVIIPKPILVQVGLTRDVDIEVEDDAVVIRKAKRHAREGWAEASRALTDAGGDALVWPEFANDDDSSLAW
jgi:antitoxin MazE